MTASPMNLSIVVAPEGPGDAPAIERLDDRAFGPGQFARTAYRLRERSSGAGTLSFVAHVSTLLVGANRLTPIRCGSTSALLLGPLTVDPAFRSRGVARALVQISLDTAKTAGHRMVILVGDEAYYKRFGFARVPAGRLVMPGPVDPARLLYLELEPGVFLGVTGAVRAV